MEIIFRSIIMFIVLFLIIKILGKKQIKNLPLYDGIIAIFVFAIIGYVTTLAAFHSHTIEEVVDGEPLVLFENNNFNYENLENAKLSVAKVLENCRLKGCFDINELDCAVLEPSGDISILLKGKSQPITSNDLKENVQKNISKQTLCYNLVVDGKIDAEELKKAKKTKTWLNNYLKEKHKHLENITLLSIDKNNKVTLFEK